MPARRFAWWAFFVASPSGSADAYEDEKRAVTFPSSSAERWDRGHRGQMKGHVRVEARSPHPRPLPEGEGARQASCGRDVSLSHARASCPLAYAWPHEKCPACAGHRSSNHGATCAHLRRAEARPQHSSRYVQRLRLHWQPTAVGIGLQIAATVGQRRRRRRALMFQMHPIDHIGMGLVARQHLL